MVRVTPIPLGMVLKGEMKQELHPRLLLQSTERSSNYAQHSTLKKYCTVIKLRKNINP